MLNRLFLVLDVLLLVTAGALGVHLYRIWAASPPAAAAPPPAAPTAPVPAAAAAPRSASPATLGIIAERNLFSPTRSEVAPEPPKPVTATPMAPVRPVEKPRLYGVVLGTDGGARAYLWDPQTRKVFGYKVGDSLGDSRVEQINPDRVVLRRSGEALEVLLRDPAKPKPAPAVPAPVAVPGVPGSPGMPQFPGQFPGAPGQATSPIPQAVPGQPGSEGAPTFTPPAVGGPTFPTQRPGAPAYPVRPPVRIPPGQPAGPRSPAQPQPSGESGS
jgi:Type II secretion system protein C